MRVTGVVLACALLVVSLVASLGSCADPSMQHVRYDFTVPDGAVGDDLAERDLHVAGDMGTDDGGGHGTCDLATRADGGDATLFVAGVTTSGAPYVAQRFAGTWSVVTTAGTSFSAMTATSIAGSPMIVTRGTDDTLGSAIDDPCNPGLAAPVALFDQALTGGTPSAVGGTQVDLVFRGSIGGDERLYATTFTGSWSAASTLTNFLSTLPFAAVRVGTAIHVLFTGTDSNIYDGVSNTNGGTATAITNAMSNAGPAAVTTSGGTTYLAFLGQDTNLYWSASTSGGSWSAPTLLCAQQTSCVITSSLAPVIALDRSDVPFVAWVGTNGIVYTTQLDTTTSIWSAALAATTETTSLQPGLATGLDGDDVELVYVRASDAQPRHVSESAGAVTAAVSLPAGALAAAPSVVRIVAP